MTTIEAAPAAGADSLKSVTGQQTLRAFSEQRSVSLDTASGTVQRERMAQTLKHGEERNVLEATKDLAANVFSAFRNELREALAHIGITGEKAADLVREVGTSFVEALRDGSGFSFALIAAAYRETITQTATQVSHGLEFSARTLTIDYNHVTGEIVADTSKLEFDAVKLFGSDNLPSAEALSLFDFTDSEGPPGIGHLFDRVRQYLETNGFIDAADEAAPVPALPDADAQLYDVALVNDRDAAAGEEDAGAETPGRSAAGEAGLDAVRIRAIEKFANARQETVTRMTLDLMVRVHLGKDSHEPEIFRLENKDSESFQVTA